MRDRREGSLSSASGGSSQPSPPHVRAALTSFQPRPVTGTLSEQTTPRHLARHPAALKRGPCLFNGSPVHLRSASSGGQARSLSEGQLGPPRVTLMTAPLVPRHHHRVRRESSASSESSGASGAHGGGGGGSSDERDSGFSTFPRSVRSWSSASLRCRLQPKEVVLNSGSTATLSGAGSQQSCCLTPASVSQQDLAPSVAEQQPDVTDVHLSPGRRRSKQKTPTVAYKRSLQPSAPPAHRDVTAVAASVV